MQAIYSKHLCCHYKHPTTILDGETYDYVTQIVLGSWIASTQTLRQANSSQHALQLASVK